MDGNGIKTQHGLQAASLHQLGAAWPAELAVDVDPSGINLQLIS
jgi:hypothetical protein